MSVREVVTDMRATTDRLQVSLAKLDQAETVIEDLKQQLDGALGAEEIMQQLTEKTFSMSEVSSNFEYSVSCVAHAE